MGVVRGMLGKGLAMRDMHVEILLFLQLAKRKNCSKGSRAPMPDWLPKWRIVVPCETLGSAAWEMVQRTVGIVGLH